MHKSLNPAQWQRVENQLKKIEKHIDTRFRKPSWKNDLVSEFDHLLLLLEHPELAEGVFDEN